ncbi:MAG TPA: MgtC/SapB family protein [Ktedonobacteraceae bacterium]|nr:MgtC/SapB family protein [Ktedonobacteraceae bacterium]
MIPIQTALLRLTLALLLGALVGLERERGERTAGLRTHALVALGACLTMIVSAFGFTDILGTPNVVLDPSRIAAQVISGIGFLGAGTILLRKEIVKGLTTAAAIWVVAAIGLACGAGLLLEAIFTTVLTIIVLTLLQSVRRRVRRTPEVHHLRIKVTAEPSLLNRVYDICIQMKVTIELFEVQTGNGSAKMEIVCATSEAVRLTRSLVALRTAKEMENISISLRNPTNNLALFPLFSEEQTEPSEESLVR